MRALVLRLMLVWPVQRCNTVRFLLILSVGINEFYDPQVRSQPRCRTNKVKELTSSVSDSRSEPFSSDYFFPTAVLQTSSSIQEQCKLEGYGVSRAVDSLAILIIDARDEDMWPLKKLKTPSS